MPTNKIFLANGTTSNAFITSLTGTSGIAFKGVTTNVAGTTGYVRHIITVNNATAATLIGFGASSGSWGAIAAATLYPGDWDVFATVNFTGSPSLNTYCAISLGQTGSVAGVSGDTEKYWSTFGVVSQVVVLKTICRIASGAGTVPFYLNLKADYVAGTALAAYRMYCRLMS